MAKNDSANLIREFEAISNLLKEQSAELVRLKLKHQMMIDQHKRSMEDWQSKYDFDTKEIRDELQKTLGGKLSLLEIENQVLEAIVAG
jgi:hypothetical protein